MAVKKGKLTLVEKMAIKQCLAEKKDVKEIAKMTNRSENIVRKYIDEELDQLVGDIVRAQMEAEERKAEEDPQSERYSRPGKFDIQTVKPEEPTERDLEDIASDKVIQATFKELVKAGLTDKDAQKVIEKSLQKAYNTNGVFKSMESLYAESIKQMKSGDFMKKRTEGGQEGVAIMTPAASQRVNMGAIPNRKMGPDHIHSTRGE